MPDVKLKDLLKERFGGFMLEKKKGVLDDDEIIIPQIGRMTFKQLKKSIEGKTKVLDNIIKQGDYDKISDEMLQVLSHFIRVARAYSTGGKVPQGTQFK